MAIFGGWRHAHLVIGDRASAGVVASEVAGYEQCPGGVRVTLRSGKVVHLGMSPSRFSTAYLGWRDNR